MRRLLGVIFCVAFSQSVCAEDAAEFESRGIAALKLSQNQSDAIISAAIYFGQAASAYDRAGKSAKSAEMNSFLYWCAKKISAAQKDVLLKQGGAGAAEALKRFSDSEKALPATDAQAYFDRAEAFAGAHADEHFLIGVRFFEVAERFRETQVGARARERSSKELVLLQIPGAAETKEKPAAAEAPVAQPGVAAVKSKMPVPDAETLKSEKAKVNTAYTAKFGDTPLDMHDIFARKLVEAGEKAVEADAQLYAQMHEARELAAGAGDVAMAMRAIEVMERHFEFDSFSEKFATLKKAYDAARSHPPKTADLRDIYPYYRPFAVHSLLLIEEMIRDERFEKFTTLKAIGDQASREGQNAVYQALIADRARLASERQSALNSFKAMLEKLKSSPDDPNVNLAVGRYYCLIKINFAKGLPYLAKGSNPTLKTLAQRDLAKPSEPAVQVSLADGWWAYAESDMKQNAAFQERALYWYELAAPKLAANDKASVEKRLQSPHYSSLPPRVGFAQRIPLPPQNSGHSFDVTQNATYTLSSSDPTYPPRPDLFSDSLAGRDILKFKTADGDPAPHIIVDLGAPYGIDNVDFRFMTLPEELKTLTVWTAQDPKGPWIEFWRAKPPGAPNYRDGRRIRIAQYLKIGLREQAPFSLHRVIVYGQ